MAWVVAGGKVTIPLLVREVLKIKEGDYVRININEAIKRNNRESESEAEVKKLLCLQFDVVVGQRVSEKRGKDLALSSIPNSIQNLH